MVDDFCDCAALTKKINRVRSDTRDPTSFPAADTMKQCCSGAGESCPKGSAKCSKLMNCPICREWALSAAPKAKEAADAVMREWCDKNFDRSNPELPSSDPACRCVERQWMPDFTKYKTHYNFEDRCWYVPCADAGLSRYLVQSGDREAKCPDSVCQNFAEVVDSEGASVEDLRQTIVCAGATSPPTAWELIAAHAEEILAGSMVLLGAAFVGSSIIR